MVKDMQNEEFRGLSAGAGEDSLPKGYFIVFENIDSFLGNVMRPRQGLKRVISSGLLATPCIGSGTFTQTFSDLPSSGSNPDGRYGNFDRIVMSGLYTNHTASGKYAQAAKDGSDQVWGVIVGDYAAGHLFDSDGNGVVDARTKWAAGYSWDQSVSGTYCSGEAIYSRAVSNSGYVTDDLQPGIGVTACIQPEIEAYYEFHLGYATFGGVPFVWGNLQKNISGIQTFKDAKSFSGIGTGSGLQSELEGEIKIVVTDNGDGTCDVKSYFQGLEAISFTDNGASGLGTPLVSGLVGIGGECDQTPTTATWNFITEWDGGSEGNTIGPINDSGNIPSGYAVVTEAYEPFGKLNYFFIDASGRMYRRQEPLGEP